MKNSLILIITEDAQFRQTVMDAALETRHGVRLAQTFDEAQRELLHASEDIALAVVDLDLGHDEESIRTWLGTTHLDLPILAAAHEPDLFFYDPALTSIAADYLIKPVAADEIRHKILELSRASGEFAEPALPHW